MHRWPAAVGNTLRLLAVASLAVAVTELRQADRETAATEGEAFHTPHPERVALRIDGWIIEVDGIEAPAPPPVGTRPPAVVRMRRARTLLSRYDHLIHLHATSHGLDWRLVAALIREESGFKPEAVSPRGAVGLMQVRPIAAEEVGESVYAAPNDNIRTGVRYLKRLDGIFASAPEGRDRLALVLAAYNMGPAHVQDAQLLARHYGFDPYRWDGAMARILPLLEDPTFHSRLPAGYAQGRGTVIYVERILDRYDRYKVEAGEIPGYAGPVPQAASASG